MRLTPPLRQEDLDILGASRHGVARETLLSVVIGLSVTSIGTWCIDMFVTSVGILTFVTVATAVSAWSYVRPSQRVRRMADTRRGEFDLAAAVLLDLVNIQTAGGAGIETALISAASLGDGWCFREIRRTLTRAQAARASYWDALLELGRCWGITSVTEIAHSARLAGEHGARVRQSLVTKAQSLRDRNLARIEHEAHQRTEQMGLPMVVLFLSFLVFVGYPALAQTTGAL